MQKIIYFTLILLIKSSFQQLPINECNTRRSNTFCQIMQYNETHPRFMPVSNIPNKEVQSVNLVGYLGARMHTMTSDLCDAFPNIEIFNADFLGLEKVEENAFDNCKKLERLYFSRNKLQDDDLKPGLFKNNLKLRSLLLEGNQFKKLDLTVFNNLQKLEELRLYRNELEQFELKDLTPLKKLDSLYLEYNQLPDVDEKEILVKFPNLKEISLCNNAKINSARLKNLKDFFKAKNVTMKCLNDDKFNAEYN
uniref:CSON000809 protein n=1 Tax=Culicoides sonorensis TaxID=179676 RepID=A0A336MFS3_CULSO